MLPSRMGFGMTLETLALGLIDSILSPFWSVMSHKLSVTRPAKTR
jgi:hypothetical protein